MECLDAKIDANLKNLIACQEHLKEEIKASSERMKEEMKAWKKERLVWRPCGRPV